MNYLIQSFMAPQTDAGKSLRDAIFTAVVIGIIAALESVDTNSFGDYAPVMAAVISFLVARANRYIRQKPNSKNK